MWKIPAFRTKIGQQWTGTPLPQIKNIVNWWFFGKRTEQNRCQKDMNRKTLQRLLKTLHYSEHNEQPTQHI